MDYIVVKVMIVIYFVFGESCLVIKYI